MKRFELKTLQGDGVIVDYKSVLIDVVKRHPNGITLDEMGKALRVINAIKDATTEIRLEDADWETLVAYLKVYPFAIVDEKLLTMKDDVEKAETVKI